MIDYKKQGKKNLRDGRIFELKVRADLESKGFICSRWQNNVELKKGKCIPARQGKFRKTSTGFPDFIAFKLCYNSPTNNHRYDVQFIECKSNGYLKPEERAKAKWYLENKYCSKFLIASKGKEKGEIVYKEFGK